MRVSSLVLRVTRNAILCAAALVVAVSLAACGSDSLATTQQARESGQAASASAAQQTSDDAASSQQATSSASAEAHQVVVIFDSSNAAAYNSKFPETLGTFTVDVEPGMTVLDALEATGIDYDTRGKDYVSSIGGIADKVCGRDSGWEYLVDGEIPLKSANDYELSGGETVRWAYTVVEGDVGEGQQEMR